MQGGAPRVVWLTLGVDPRAISVTSAAHRLIDEGRPCHLVWNPLTGEIAQLLPIMSAGRMLGTREHLRYDPNNPHPMPSVNREGRLCVQIGVLGLAKEPFTGYPILNHTAITEWLDSWHIPRRWPAGQPVPYRQTERPRSRALWARGGHYGASQVPDTTSMGPGCIDIDQLIGTESVTLNGVMPTHPPAAISLSPRIGRQARDVSTAVPLTAAGVLRARLEPVPGGPPPGGPVPGGPLAGRAPPVEQRPTGAAMPGGLYTARSLTIASGSFRPWHIQRYLE